MFMIVFLIAVLTCPNLSQTDPVAKDIITTDPINNGRNNNSRENEEIPVYVTTVRSSEMSSDVSRNVKKYKAKNNKIDHRSFSKKSKGTKRRRKKKLTVNKNRPGNSNEKIVVSGSENILFNYYPQMEGIQTSAKDFGLTALPYQQYPSSPQVAIPYRSDGILTEGVSPYLRKLPGPQILVTERPYLHRTPTGPSVGLRPIIGQTAAIRTTFPPIRTVTHVVKYDANHPAGLRLPFLHEEEIDFGAISAALDHNHKMHSLPSKFLTPPKLNQPIYYGNQYLPTPYLLPTVPAFTIETGTELGAIETVVAKGPSRNTSGNKVKKIKNKIPKNQNSESEEDKVYREEDIIKAMKYLRKQRKKNSSSRKHRKNKQRKRVEEESEEESNNRDSKPEMHENESAEDDRAEPFSDDQLEGDESNRKISKIPRAEKSAASKSVKSENNREDLKTEEIIVNPTVLESPVNAESDTENQVTEHLSENMEVGSENGGDRVEFQVHGLRGPESYKFGYDTGKGSNRQFRYEERDADGNVKGHYGYYDGEGQLHVYNYAADENGYQLEQGTKSSLS